MCDDCTDVAWQEVYARDDEIERLKRQVELLTSQRDEWTKETQSASAALYAMHQLAIETTHVLDDANQWAVPADEIKDVYEAWMKGDYDV